MLFNFNKLLVSLCFLFIFGCSTVGNNVNELANKQRVNQKSVTVVTQTSIIEKVKTGLGKLLASKKMRLGKQLDLQDQQILGSLAANTLERSIEKDITTWENPATGHKGAFKVLKTEGCPEEKLVCRNFVHTLFIDKSKEEFYGKACRDMWGPKSPWLLYIK